MIGINVFTAGVSTWSGVLGNSLITKQYFEKYLINPYAVGV